MPKLTVPQMFSRWWDGLEGLYPDEFRGAMLTAYTAGWCEGASETNEGDANPQAAPAPRTDDETRAIAELLRRNPPATIRYQPLPQPVGWRPDARNEPVEYRPAYDIAQVERDDALVYLRHLRPSPEALRAAEQLIREDQRRREAERVERQLARWDQVREAMRRADGREGEADPPQEEDIPF